MNGSCRNGLTLARLQVVNHFQHLSQLLARTGELASRDQILPSGQLQHRLQDLLGIAGEHDEVLRVSSRLRLSVPASQQASIKAVKRLANTD